ncbi:MAG: OmpA family protein [Pseudomonadota bacterium]
MRNWIKWIVPGLITVAVLTVVSVLFFAEAIQNDLTAKASKSLNSAHPWATVELEGRDLTLSGTAPTQDDQNAALGLAKDAYDVRIVKNASDLLPVVSPYVFSATKRDGKITLSGTAPKIQTKDALLQAAKKIDRGAELEDNLTLAAGASENFAEDAETSLGLLKGLSEGAINLNDDKLEISGIAETSSAYEDVLEDLETKLSSNITVAKNALSAPIADPFEWKTEFDGQEAIISGFATSREEIAEIEAKISSAIPDAKVFNRMRIASGEPEGWSNAVGFLADLFVGFESGRISLSGSNLSISGVAASFADYGEISEKLKNAPQGFTIAENTLQPVGISPYTWTVQLSEEVVTIGGYTPNVERRDTLRERIRKTFDGKQIEGSAKVAGGSPENYNAATDYALQVLSKMQVGEASLSDQKLTLTGRAKSSQAYSELNDGTLKKPEGIDVELEVELPLANPYRWTIVVREGEIKLTGNIASDQSRSRILESVATILDGKRLVDNQALASGEPAEIDAVRDLLAEFTGKLSAGQGNVVGTVASIVGRVENKQLAKAIETNFVQKLPAGYTGTTNILFPKESTEEAGTQVEISSNGVVVAGSSAGGTPSDQTTETNGQATLPIADPYRWSVSKIPSGVTVLGNVESTESAEATSQMVKDILGVSEIADRQIPASGAPAGFSDVREYVTRQLKLLEAGQGNIIGNQVSITGRAKNENLRNLIDRSVKNKLPEGYIGSTNIVFPKSELLEAKPDEVLPPVAEPFSWSISKLGSDIVLSGNVVSKEASAAIVDLVKSTLEIENVTEEQTLARGKPPGFDAATALAIQQTKLLESGKANVVDQKVEVIGTVKNQVLADLITSALQEQLPQGFFGETELSILQNESVNASASASVDDEAEACQKNIINAISGRKIQFETNRAIIRADSETILKDVTSAAINCPNVQIEVQGHTDSRGREGYNQELSEGRAKAVVQYLISAGIPAERLTAKGFGEAKPIAENETSEGRSLNRRIEFKVLQ